MFRIFYTALDVIGTILVFLSPIAVVHWLLKAVNLPDLEPVVNGLSVFFDPLNQILAGLLPITTYSLKWSGRELPITQGILGLLFTIAYLVVSYSATILKGLEKQVNNTQEFMKYQKIASERKAEDERQKKKISRNSRIWVYITYTFHDNKTGSDCFESYLQFGGQIIQSLPTDILLEFDDMDKVVIYCLESARSILSYYATLRPMDTKPPFKISIHSVQEREDDSSSLEKCRQMCHYAGNNKVVFSQEFLDLMTARGRNKHYQYFSTGFYNFSGDRKYEIFNLEVDSAGQQMI